MYGVFVFLIFPVVACSVDKDKPEDSFQKDCLDAHNTYRSEHGVPPLVWSSKLTQQAQKWADALASKDEIKHDAISLAKDNEGENLAFFSPAVPKCQESMVGNCILCREMVKRWYDEVKFYNFDNGASVNPDSITKHFTQIIWSNTSEMGIGTAISKKFGFVTVARYWPEGNKGGPEMYILNVPPEGGPLPSLPSTQTTLPEKSAGSSTPSGNGLPVTKQQQKQVKAPNLASIITPKPAQTDGNDTETTSHDPHKDVQNDDIGNTFDSRMSKDFGYEGQKMYGDVTGNNVEGNVHTNTPQIKNVNSIKQFSEKLQQQINSMEMNGDEEKGGEVNEKTIEGNIQGNLHGNGQQIKHSNQQKQELSFSNPQDTKDYSEFSMEQNGESNVGKVGVETNLKNNMVYDDSMETEGNIKDYNASGKIKNQNNMKKINNGYGMENNGKDNNNGIVNQNNGYTMENGINNQNIGKDNGNNVKSMKNNGQNNKMNNENTNGMPNNPNSLKDNEFNMENNGHNNNMNSIKNNGVNNQNIVKPIANNNNVVSIENKLNSLGSGDNTTMNNAETKGNGLVSTGTTNNKENPKIPINKDDGGKVTSIQKALKNRGLVRTVKGPDGSSAQVFLTKNGAHAGLVFRDYISRVLPSQDKTEERNTKRTIYVV